MVPRLELDEWLRQQAVDSGVRFLSGFHSQAALMKNGRVTGLQGLLNGDVQTIHARVTIAATGAAVGMPRALGIIERLPPMVLAVRAYFEGVEGLEAEFEFHFRREIAPGYAWIFPAPNGKANVGVGLFPYDDRPKGKRSPSRGPRRAAKQALYEFLGQPDMQRRFRNARMVGRLEAYPLRTDYPDSPVSGAGFLVTGEAAGLVSPVTGEGIDLAMESGEMAAAVVGDALRRGDVSARGLQPYDRRMRKRFGRWFRGTRLIQPVVMKPRALNTLIAKSRRWPGLGKTVVGILLGTVSPWLAFSPLTWGYLLF